MRDARQSMAKIGRSIVTKCRTDLFLAFIDYSIRRYFSNLKLELLDVDEFVAKQVQFLTQELQFFIHSELLSGI